MLSSAIHTPGKFATLIICAYSSSIHLATLTSPCFLLSILCAISNSLMSKIIASFFAVVFTSVISLGFAHTVLVLVLTARTFPFLSSIFPRFAGIGMSLVCCMFASVLYFSPITICIYPSRTISAKNVIVITIKIQSNLLLLEMLGCDKFFPPLFLR